MVDGSKLDGLMDRRNINMISEILIENLLNISIYNNKIIIIKYFDDPHKAPPLDSPLTYQL